MILLWFGVLSRKSETENKNIVIVFLEVTQVLIDMEKRRGLWSELLDPVESNFLVDTSKEYFRKKSDSLFQMMLI